MLGPEKDHSYVCGGPLLVLGYTALQVEREVIAVHQHTLAKLLLKLLHIRLYPREIQFLKSRAMEMIRFHFKSLIVTTWK